MSHLGELDQINEKLNKKELELTQLLAIIRAGRRYFNIVSSFVEIWNLFLQLGTFLSTAVLLKYPIKDFLLQQSI